MTHDPIHPLKNTGKALQSIGRFGWFRPQELGIFLFGAKPHARKYAEALCRTLLAEGLVLARRLPKHSGTAFVLSQMGAAMLKWWHDGGYKSGKDWGTTRAGQWYPPASWEHDLAAIGLLAHLSAAGWEICPEIDLRRDVRDGKRPDGLAYNRNDDHSYWIEVEASRKSGTYLKEMVVGLIKAARGKPNTCYDRWQHHPVAHAMVGIERFARDDRNYTLDHWHRIHAAIGKIPLASPVTITVAWLTFRGAGVARVELEERIISP